MTRSALLIVAVVTTTAVAGFALCAGMGWPFSSARIAPPAVTALLASGAALIPLSLSRGAMQPAVAQAALVGTMVHLFGCLAGAAVLLLVLKHGTSSTVWVLAFYWATLAVLVVEFGRVVRAAPHAAPASPAGPKQ